MTQRPTMLLAMASCVALATAFSKPYPYTHKNCGIEQTISDTPQKVITMNQGATEFMLAMGLQNNIAGQRAVSELDPIWPRYV
jgi:iron complex transport system substrate-binding protein